MMCYCITDNLKQNCSLQCCGTFQTEKKQGYNIFVTGTTRDNFENKTVLQLEYEAYNEMACREIKKICDSVRTKWPQVEHIAIFHRLGYVNYISKVCALLLHLLLWQPNPNFRQAVQKVKFPLSPYSPSKKFVVVNQLK